MVTRHSCLLTTGALIAMAAAVCSAQNITSARSGTLHYFEGDVSIDGVQVQSKIGKFPEIGEQSVLRTALGRAEVLLTPGVFLRVGENSSIRMLDRRLTATRVELLSGTVMMESDDPQMSMKDSPVSLIYKDYEIRMVKHGLLEISAEAAQLKVFKGEGFVAVGDHHVVVKDGHLVSFSDSLTVAKFDEKNGDDLYVWSRDRSQNLSAANMSSARSLNSSGSGYGFSGVGTGGWNGGWYYNPYFGMFTFVPVAGTLWNPWGYGFFSPVTIYNYYAPTAYWYGAGGARGASTIGRPISTFTGASTTAPAPISRLGGGSGPPALGSPIRGGGFSAPGAGAGAAPPPTAASRGGFSTGMGMPAGGGGGAHMGGGHAGGIGSGTRGR